MIDVYGTVFPDTKLTLALHDDLGILNTCIDNFVILQTTRDYTLEKNTASLILTRLNGLSQNDVYDAGPLKCSFGMGCPEEI